MAVTKFEVILEILFLKISNADVLFGEEILTWRTYTTNETLSIIEHVQIFNLKEIVIAMLNVNSKMFLIYVSI